MIVYYWLCIIFSIAYAGNIPGGKTKRKEYRKTLEEEIATLYETESHKVWDLNSLTSAQGRKLCYVVNEGYSGVFSSKSGTIIQDKYVLKYRQTDHSDTKMDVILCELFVPTYYQFVVIEPSEPTRIFLLFPGDKKHFYVAKTSKRSANPFEIKVISKMEVPDETIAQRVKTKND